MNNNIFTFTTNQFWLELLHTYVFLLHLILSVPGERRVTVAESNSMHDIKDQNKPSAKVSPVSCLKKKMFSYNNLFLCSYYIHIYIVSTLYIRKYSANIAIGSRESDRAASRVPWPRGCKLETQRGHKFSGNTAKSVCKKTPRNLNFPRI